ncbi:MAG TPA: hypothetical protein VGP07_27100 [Polyangia bacterium]|jgi:hypothetical protein
MDLRAATEQLFDAPLDAFVEVRTRLAAELAREGKKEDSRALKQLRRPTTSAWVTNRVVRRDRGAVEAFLLASDQLRDSQGTMRDGGGSRAAYQSAAEAFRRATTVLTEAARQALLAAGREAERTLVERVVSNVRSAALVTARRAELLTGQLIADLDAGEAALLGLLGGTLEAGAAGAVLPGRREEKPAVPVIEEKARDGRAEREEEGRRAHEAAERARREEHARRLEVAREEEASAGQSAASAATALAEARAVHDAASDTLRQAEATVVEARHAAQATEARRRELERDATRADAEARRTTERREDLQRDLRKEGA